MEHILREEAHNKVEVWINEETQTKIDITGKWHYGKKELHRDIDRIYDSLDAQLKEAQDKLGGEVVEEFETKLHIDNYGDTTIPFRLDIDDTIDYKVLVIKQGD